MASQATLDISKQKKKQKIFGAMTTSRWIGVCIFLCATLLSYNTSGPSLERLWELNFYFRDYRPYDRTTMRREGSDQVIDSVFAPKYFHATWFQQMASHLGEVDQVAWSDSEEKLYFVDSLAAKIFSYNKWKGLDIEYEYNNTEPTKGGLLVRNGPSGIILDETEPNTIYVSESAFNRIARLNLKTGKRTIVADLKESKSPGVPYHLTLSPSKEYLYFTDPLASGVFRVNLKKTPYSVELVTSQVQHPCHVTFSTRHPNRVFVSNCVEKDYSVFVFQIDAQEKWSLSEQWNVDTLQWKNSTIQGHVGCVRSLASFQGQLLVTCPGGRICFIDEKTGVMKAGLKLYDGVILNDILIGGNQIWMASNFSLWRSYLQTSNTKIDL